MPVTILSGRDTRERLKTNPQAYWPERSDSENRIEPVASPGFTPSFAFAPGATVFTIGSCFARNVQAALLARGFRIPTREFWSDVRSTRATDNWILDNYGVPAICNEIAWALGEAAPHDPNVHLFEVYPGRFCDLHLSSRVPLCSFEEAVARRDRIFKASRSILEAEVIVMTLGLVEVWWDKAASAYLNTRPNEAVLLTNPERFELHILDYNDVLAWLERIFDIVFRRCRPATNVILTVSPVPMGATYGGDDVCVANQYSKSVLRAAAEVMRRNHARID